MINRLSTSIKAGGKKLSNVSSGVAAAKNMTKRRKSKGAEELKRRIQELSEENGNYKLQVSQLKDMLRTTTAAGTKNCNTDAVSTQMNKLKATHKEDLDRLLVRIKSKDAEIDTLKGLVSERERAIESLKKKESSAGTSSQMSSKIQVLEKKIAESYRREEILRKDMKQQSLKLAEEKAVVDGELSEALKHQNLLKQKVSSSNMRRVEAESKALSLVSKNEELQDSLTKMNVRLLDAEKQAAAGKARIEKMTSEAEKVAKRMEELTRAEEQYNETSETLTKRCEAAETTLESNNQELAKRNEELVEAKAKLKTLEHDIDDVRVESKLKTKKSMQMIKDLRSQLSKLHSKFSRLEVAYKKITSSPAKSSPATNGDTTSSPVAVPRRSATPSKAARSPELSTDSTSSTLNKKRFSMKSMKASIRGLTGKKSSKEDNIYADDVACDLSKRLRELLTENEMMKEKVRFLEDTISLLNRDLAIYKSQKRSQDGCTKEKQAVGADNRQGSFESAV